MKYDSNPSPGGPLRKRRNSAHAPVFPLTHLTALTFLALLACLTAIMVISGCSSGATASGMDERQLISLAEETMDTVGMPGLAVVVNDPDNRLMFFHGGTANIEQSVPVQPDTVFEIGSITKTFTAFAILMLQEEGKLSVEDHLGKYFPDYPYGDQINLRQLLQHTSGIKDFTAVEAYASNQAKDWTPDELIDMLEDVPLDFSPGEKAVYSNSGTIYLGRIVEMISGVSLAEFITERITDPLDMTQTRMGNNVDIIPHRAAGYNNETGEMKNARYVSVSAPYASGGMMSTVTDLAKFKKAFQPGVLVSAAGLDEMLAPAVHPDGSPYKELGKYGFAYGLELFYTTGGMNLPSKTGGISGFNAFFLYVPHRNLFFAATSNMDHTLLDLAYLARDVIAYYGVYMEI